MNENKIMDQSQLAEDVATKIPYEFQDYFLVKPLDPIKVSKTFTTPKPKTEEKTEVDGIEAVDYEETVTEVKEVDSDFRKGVVLKVPRIVERDPNVAGNINVGDIVLFSDRAGRWFDLLKDSKLIRYYDIVAIEK